MRKRLPSDRFGRRLPSWRSIGLLALMGFALFTAFKIFQDPVVLVQIARSPDGARTAKLEHLYHTPEPSLKISILRGRFWRTLQVIPSHDGHVFDGTSERLRWSTDSTRLFLDLDGSPVWMKEFDPAL